MIDIKLIRENSETVEEKLRNKDPDVCLYEIVELDKKQRELATELDNLRNKKNVISDEIGNLKRAGKDAAEKLEIMQEAAKEIKKLEPLLNETTVKLEKLLHHLPNIPDESVPKSLDKDKKITVRTYGEKPQFNFKIKNHLEIGEALNLFDFERGAKISKSQFPLYKGVGAQLEWALIQFMLDTQTKENKYELIMPPLLVNSQTMFTSGNLPKFEEQLYKCRDDELYIVPTAEVPLGSIFRDEIITEEKLPLYYCAYTPCFRREAGTYGATERGLIRVHQFNKVELFKFVTPETSYQELETLVRDAEQILQKLNLCYRVTLLPTGDISQQSAKTYDIEVWLPGQDAYYEVSSCSNCTDFQARRGNIRYRPKSDGKSKTKTQYIHTLNGSGLATPRLFVAILENFQNEDGSVTIPEVLRKYLGGMEKITI